MIRLRTKRRRTLLSIKKVMIIALNCKSEEENRRDYDQTVLLIFKRFKLQFWKIMAVNWMMLATAFVTIGFELIVFGLATAPAAAFESSDHAVEALEVCGFVCLLIAFIVLMFMQYGELKGKRTAAAIVIGGSFLGGKRVFHDKQIWQKIRQTNSGKINGLKKVGDTGDTCLIYFSRIYFFDRFFVRFLSVLFIVKNPNVFHSLFVRHHVVELTERMRGLGVLGIQRLSRSQIF